MNRVRNILIAVLVGVVFLVSFLVVKSFTKPPQKSIDFSFASADGSVKSLYDVAKDGGAVIVFFDPEVEGSNDVLTRVINIAPKDSVVAVSVSSLSIDEQSQLLPKNAKTLKNLCFDGSEIIKLYNIGNAPVTYFVDSEFYVVDAFIGNIKNKTIKTSTEKLNK